MATVTHNHANYQARLDFIQQRILAEHLGLAGPHLEQTKVVPIQYHPACPFKYNNFIYHVTLPEGSKPETKKRDDDGMLLQPGCSPMPEGTRDFIVRLSNSDAASMHPATRVENEVALISLASAALSDVPSVVPRVFFWASAAKSQQGWILQELMPGEPVVEAFEAMDLDQKRGILAQVAAILKALQDYKLPDSITGWGGVTFEDGRIVSGPMSSVGAGPWSSFEDSFRGRLRVALDRADVNPHLQGWRPNGVRERLEAFIERGLPVQFASLTSKNDRAIVHADFTTDNLLYDPSSGRITALLDYDFSSVLHPSYEFFRSFNKTGGQLLGWSGEDDDEDDEESLLRKAKLTGSFPSPLPANTKEIQWDVAQAWEEELEKQQVKRPSSIAGIDKVADVDEVLGAVKPWHVCNDDFLSMQGEGAAAFFRDRAEAKLVKLLDHLGF